MINRLYARAKSQEPRAKSQEPRAKSQEPLLSSVDFVKTRLNSQQSIEPPPDKKQTILAILVPAYNEQEVLPETTICLLNKLNHLINEKIISPDSKIVFVDDGSTDATWNLIETYHNKNPEIIGIKLSKNTGHQNAIFCGLLTLKDIVDVIISIDADLQDDIDAIDEMIKKYLAGCEIVYGVRASRKKDSFFKRTTAHIFYRLMRFLGVNIVHNHADFRLMGKKALAALSQYSEVNLFLRCIIPLLGYTTGIVYYSRKERLAGISKYPLNKMLKFAIEGITSFSIRPIRLITIIGLSVFCISLMMILYSIIVFSIGSTILGWTSMICSIWCIGGLILLSIGIVGEYVGKIYLETKHRPNFIIEKIIK